MNNINDIMRNLAEYTRLQEETQTIIRNKTLYIHLM